MCKIIMALSHILATVACRPLPWQGHKGIVSGMRKCWHWAFLGPMLASYYDDPNPKSTIHNFNNLFNNNILCVYKSTIYFIQ